MNWWLRTYHQDGTSATVEGPGNPVSITQVVYERQTEGLACEVFEWEPGQPIPPTSERKCGKG